MNLTALPSMDLKRPSSVQLKILIDDDKHKNNCSNRSNNNSNNNSSNNNNTNNNNNNNNNNSTANSNINNAKKRKSSFFIRDILGYNHNHHHHHHHHHQQQQQQQQHQQTTKQLKISTQKDDEKVYNFKTNEFDDLPPKQLSPKENIKCHHYPKSLSPPHSESSLYFYSPKEPIINTGANNSIILDTTTTTTNNNNNNSNINGENNKTTAIISYKGGQLTSSSYSNHINSVNKNIYNNINNDDDNDTKYNKNTTVASTYEEAKLSTKPSSFTTHNNSNNVFHDNNETTIKTLIQSPIPATTTTANDVISAAMSCQQKHGLFPFPIPATMFPFQARMTSHNLATHAQCLGFPTISTSFLPRVPPCFPGSLESYLDHTASINGGNRRGDNYAFPIPLPVYIRSRSPSGTDSFVKPKKCRRSRTVFSELQLMGLEKRFEDQKYLSTPDRMDLAECLGLSQIQVKTWYQNRRMKWKKEVLQKGAKESPTKPKGRPKKDLVDEDDDGDDLDVDVDDDDDDDDHDDDDDDKDDKDENNYDADYNNNIDNGYNDDDNIMNDCDNDNDDVDDDDIVDTNDDYNDVCDKDYSSIDKSSSNDNITTMRKMKSQSQMVLSASNGNSALKRKLDDVTCHSQTFSTNGNTALKRKIDDVICPSPHDDCFESEGHRSRLVQSNVMAW